MPLAMTQTTRLDSPEFARSVSAASFMAESKSMPPFSLRSAHAAEKYSASNDSSSLSLPASEFFVVANTLPWGEALSSALT